MARRLTIEECEQKFDEGINVVRNYVDALKQAKFWEECVRFLKNAADVLRKLRVQFHNSTATQFCAALDNMIDDVMEYGKKHSA